MKHKICMHLHVLFCIFNVELESLDHCPASIASASDSSSKLLTTPTHSTASIDGDVCSDQSVPHQAPPDNSLSVTSNSAGLDDTKISPESDGRLSTIKLNLLNTLPYEIPSDVFKKIVEFD